MAVTRSNVADRYAEALFDLSREENVLDAVEGDLDALGKALSESTDLRRLVESPLFDAETKQNALTAILDKGGAHDVTKRFVGVLAQNRRVRELPALIEAFSAMAAAQRGETPAEALSAFPLTPEQEKELRSQIESSAGKKVSLTTRVDETLLGGLIVRVGSIMIDSSLRTRLTRLQRTLKEA